MDTKQVRCGLPAWHLQPNRMHFMQASRVDKKIVHLSFMSQEKRKLTFETKYNKKTNNINTADSTNDCLQNHNNKNFNI